MKIEGWNQEIGHALQRYLLTTPPGYLDLQRAGQHACMEYGRCGQTQLGGVGTDVVPRSVDATVSSAGSAEDDGTGALDAFNTTAPPTPGRRARYFPWDCDVRVNFLPLGMFTYAMLGSPPSTDSEIFVIKYSRQMAALRLLCRS